MVRYIFDDASESQAVYPRPTGRSLEPSELQPADVLLSRGSSELSDCIVSADGGSYSHAALWSGDALIEARLDGVRERALYGEHDVYRYAGSAPDWTPELAARVVSAARRRVGQRYASHELYLLGTLFALGFCPRRSLLRTACELLGSDRAEQLERWLTRDNREGRPVICSELVAISFYEAAPEARLALRVLPVAARPRKAAAVERAPLLWSEAERSLLEQVRTGCLAVLGESEAPALARPAATQPTTPRKLLWGSLAVEASSGAKLGVITPADLQFSPSMRFVGPLLGPPPASRGQAG